MSDPTALADRYIAAWNETDAGRRQALVAAAWTEDAQYRDPKLAGDGQAGIHAMIGQVHATFPGHRFHRTGPVDAHGDRLRFAWALAPEGGPPLVCGTDFAVVAADGRLASVTGFFDAAPAAAA